MTNEKISIIVPVYNAEKYIEKCLQSIVNQTYTDLEIICVNDASSDNSYEILKKYESLDSRVHVINKENEGVSLARNKGLDVATGGYVMFVDADDWLEENACEEALKEAFEKNADVVMWAYLSEHENSSTKKSVFDSDEIIFNSEEVKNKLHRRFIGIIDNELVCPEKADSLCTVWGKLYRRSLIVDNQIFFPDIREIGTYEDGLFNLYLFRYVQKAVYFDKPLYHYRRTNLESVTSGYKPEFEKQWDKLFGIMENYIRGNDLPHIYEQALDNRVALSILGLGLNVLTGNDSAVSKIKKIKQLLSRDRYRKAVKNLALKYFPIHWKLFYVCAKYKFSLGIFVLLNVIKRIIKG